MFSLLFEDDYMFSLLLEGDRFGRTGSPDLGSEKAYSS